MRMLVLAAALMSATHALSAPPPPSDRQSLEALKVAADDAWNDKDAARMAGLYESKASLRVAPEMAEVAGREQIGRFFETAFARRPGEFRHVTSLDGAEMLDSNSVMTEGFVRVERKNDKGEWVLARRFRTLSMAVRTSEGWRLRWVRAVPLS